MKNKKFLVRRYWFDEVVVEARSKKEAEEKGKNIEDYCELDSVEVEELKI